MPSNNWDRDIKNVPVMRTDNPILGVKRFLTRTSSADTGTGVNSARKNIRGHQ